MKPTTKGIFKSHKLGFGFVKHDNKEFPEDIFIPKDETGPAIEGDLVEIQITNTQSKKGAEGKILSILERKHMILGGTVTNTTKGKIYVLCPLLGMMKEVEIFPPKKQKIVQGDRIVIEVKKGNQSKNKIKGQYISHIGHIEDPSCDIKSALFEFNLARSFPPEVHKEIEKLPGKIDPAKYTDRKDLRHLVTMTIDPDTAKDFDDALSIEKKPNGHYLLGVHIADVSYFVKPGTHLDKEASMRCNSTYFPSTCISMLPPHLADNLCSLKPDVPRLTVSTMMTFDEKGKLIHYQIDRTIIESKRRFSYKEAKKILDKTQKDPFYKTLKMLEELALILKSQRKERGCIDLSLTSSKIVVSKDGKPKGMEIIEYDITHQMIEEFMLKNNEVIAKHLSDKKIPIPFRVHEPPKAESIADFIFGVETMGFKIKGKPTQKEIQNLFEEIKGCAMEHQLSVLFIRSMKLAFYSPENIGHYGLQLEYYCHFTSPIRRYVDLIIHRQLFREPLDGDLTEIAYKCSDQERLSAKAENSVKTLKILRLLKQGNEKKEKPIYSGFITKVKPFGVFFDLPDFLFEGFLHISNLGRDYYIYKSNTSTISGERDNEQLTIGTEIFVQIKSLCLITQEVEWIRSSKDPKAKIPQK